MQAVSTRWGGGGTEKVTMVEASGEPGGRAQKSQPRRRRARGQRGQPAEGAVALRHAIAPSLAASLTLRADFHLNVLNNSDDHMYCRARAVVMGT